MEREPGGTWEKLFPRPICASNQLAIQIGIKERSRSIPCENFGRLGTPLTPPQDFHHGRGAERQHWANSESRPGKSRPVPDRHAPQIALVCVCVCNAVPSFAIGTTRNATGGVLSCALEMKVGE